MSSASWADLNTVSPAYKTLVGNGLAKNLEALIVSEGPDTIAALVAEPVMGAGGVALRRPHERRFCVWPRFAQALNTT